MATGEDWAYQDNLNCIICARHLIIASEPISALVCGHVYHDRCLKAWLPRLNECPKCRTVQSVKQVRRLFLSDSLAPQRTQNGNDRGKNERGTPSRYTTSSVIQDKGGVRKTSPVRVLYLENVWLNAELDRVNPHCSLLQREVDFSEGIRAQLCEDTADLREKIRVLAAKVNVLTREVHRAQQRGHVLEGRLLGREEEFHNLAENLGVGVAGHRPFMKRAEPLPARVPPASQNSRYPHAFRTDDGAPPPCKKRRLFITLASSHEVKPRSTLRHLPSGGVPSLHANPSSGNADEATVDPASQEDRRPNGLFSTISPPEDGTDDYFEDV